MPQASGRAINIHHSFLPSFKGAKPYYQAHDRGVKLIGATAHYVTADLTKAPSSSRTWPRRPHRHGGRPHSPWPRHREPVLARAVKWHSEHRVLLNGHRRWCSAEQPVQGTPMATPAPRPPGARNSTLARRIPPIQCLLTFEALARLRSVTLTADELCVTPSAVSHRVKQLEQMLGTRLFGRADFSLTTDGSAHLAHVREGLTPAALSRRGHTGQAPAAWPSRPPLRAWCHPDPAPAPVHRGLPEIDLTLQVSIPLLDVVAEDADLMVRFGTGATPTWSTPEIDATTVTPGLTRLWLREHGPLSARGPGPCPCCAARWNPGAPGLPPPGWTGQNPAPARSSTTWA